MNTKDFIEALKIHRDGNIKSVKSYLERTAGRAPRLRHVELSEFYNSLSDEQKRKIEGIIEKSVDLTTFSFLCILDHVSFLEDSPEKSQLELYAVKNGERTLLNDPDNEELHNLFNELVLD